MTNNYKKHKAIQQKLNNILRNKDGFSFVEVIIVIAMILILTAILIPSYLGFVETAREANVKISAQNMYTSVQMANLNLESLETSQELYDELKKLNPALIGVGAEFDEQDDAGNNYFGIAEFNEDGTFLQIDSLLYEELPDNSCAVGDIELGEIAGFSFKYYQYMNKKLYIVYFDNGELGEVISCDIEFPVEDSSDDEMSFE